MAAGAALLLVPAWLKTRMSVDEVVTTLLLNFIVLLFVSAMLDGPMKDPTALGWPQSVTVKPELEFSRLLEKSRLHTGFLWAIGAALLLQWLGRATVLGFEMRAVGSNPRAAGSSACRSAGWCSRRPSSPARWPDLPAPRRWPVAPAT